MRGLLAFLFLLEVRVRVYARCPRHANESGTQRLPFQEPLQTAAGKGRGDGRWKEEAASVGPSLLLYESVAKIIDFCPAVER